MPSIDIRRPHSLPLPEARAVIERVAERMREKFATDSHWQGDTLHFARQGVKGTIAVAGDEVRVNAELGLLLSPLKSMIEQEIRRKLDEHFA
jgi:putative polyhydroxyalkanoate system protein